MAKKKKGDFEKTKLKVGKGKLKQANQTDTSFKAKSISVPSQLRGPSIDTYFALVKHHQAPQRRQALANIVANLHLYPRQLVSALEVISSLLVDEDRQVRQGAVSALDQIDLSVLASQVQLVLLYIHAAMTHISTQIRADATKGLDLMIRRCPDEVARVGFARSLNLFFPLLGWAVEGNDTAKQSENALSLGKLATKTRSVHLQSLCNLIQLGLSPDPLDGDILYHRDTARFLIPRVPSPFSAGFTEDSEERREVLIGIFRPLNQGLETCAKEGGENGRIAAKVTELLKSLA